MFSRLLSVPVLLGAAVGVPYLASNATDSDGVFGRRTVENTSVIENHALRQMQQPLPSQTLNGPGSTLYPNATPLEGFPAMSLHEVFDFNVSKEWVYQRWARKSTALSELGLLGIRVPLVTGTQLHDLAGSLTYFFSNDGRVSRISFHGTTGDTTQLVMLATQQFGLQPQSTPVAGEQLLHVRRKDQVFSELRTRPASVLWASSPHDSFDVDFEVQRPDVTTPLPSRLAPLPVVKAPVQTPVQTTTKKQSNIEAAKRAKQTTKKSDAIDPEHKWNPYFPRSRVPAKQVDGLERRMRMW